MNNKKLEKYGLSLLCTEYNPSRGWYNIFPFRLKKDYDFEELKWSLKKNEGIVLARICIGDFKDRELDEKAIGQINDILEFFKKYEREVILRFVYYEDGKGLENEPVNRKLGRDAHIEICRYNEYKNPYGSNV